MRPPISGAMEPPESTPALPTRKERVLCHPEVDDLNENRRELSNEMNNNEDQKDSDSNVRPNEGKEEADYENLEEKDEKDNEGNHTDQNEADKEDDSEERGDEEGEDVKEDGGEIETPDEVSLEAARRVMEFGQMLRENNLASHDDVPQLLLDHFSSGRDNGNMALRQASRGGHFDLVRLMLLHRANVNALSMASIHGDTAVAQILLEDAGAALVDEKDNEGWTPLQRVCSQGHADLTRLLLDHQARVNEKTGDGFTPLALASEGGHVEVAQVLLDRRTDPSAVNERIDDGRTPLAVACSKDDAHMAEFLLKRGASVDVADHEGNTPLHHAVAGARIRFLISRNPPGGCFMGPLRIRLLPGPATGSYSVAELLVREYGASLAICNHEGLTPLELAAVQGKPVSLLYSFLKETFSRR